MRRAVLPRSSGMALALLMLAGCADRVPPLPVLTGVVPTAGLVDQSMAIQVAGTGFAVRVFTDFGDPGQSHAADAYRVTIGGVALTGVQHVSPTQLIGTLPVGVAQGLNALAVTDPWGRTATLADAYFGVSPGGLPVDLTITAPSRVPLGTCQGP